MGSMYLKLPLHTRYPASNLECKSESHKSISMSLPNIEKATIQSKCHSQTRPYSSISVLRRAALKAATSRLQLATRTSTHDRSTNVQRDSQKLICEKLAITPTQTVPLGSGNMGQGTRYQLQKVSFFENLIFNKPIFFVRIITFELEKYTKILKRKVRESKLGRHSTSLLINLPSLESSDRSNI